MTRSSWLRCMVCLGGLVGGSILLGVSWAQADGESLARAASSQGDKKKSETYRFSKKDIGKMARGWIADVTGSKQGTAPRWEVKQDEGRSVLAQLEAGGAGGDFPVCLKKNSSLKEGTVSVRLKPISGNKDQAGGIVFRAKDKDNFYIARANALEDNVSFYFIRDRKRTTLKYWENIPVKLGEWHTLKVKATGFTFKVWLNDKLVGEIEDTGQIFPDAGMVGVWTKADSVTYFDNLVVQEGAKE